MTQRSRKRPFLECSGCWQTKTKASLTGFIEPLNDVPQPHNLLLPNPVRPMTKNKGIRLCVQEELEARLLGNTVKLQEKKLSHNSQSFR